MLPTVNLDDKIGMVTKEIDDVWPRMATKICAIHAMRAQGIPNDPLCIS
jgi:hypothetical protein